MIQSDHLAGKRMRRRREANRLINRSARPPEKVLATRTSMSHLVPLLEFNRVECLASDAIGSGAGSEPTERFFS
jgi:hypothetical protein